MLTRTFLVASTGLLAVTAADLRLRASNTIDALVARQSAPPTFPAQCTTCNSVYNTVETCTTTSCLCTSATASGMSDCVNCLVTIDPSTSDITEGANLLASLNEQCASVTGFPTLSLSDPVPSATATNSEPSFTLSSPSLTETQTGGSGSGSQKSITASASSPTTSSAGGGGGGLKGLNGAVSERRLSGIAGVGVLGLVAGLVLL